MKTAIIDIGSNSVRLMLWADGTTLYKRLKTTRLGEGIAATSRLMPEAIERSAQAVSAFYKEGVSAGAETVYAFATAAVRSATNGTEFCKRVKELCGLEVDVVAGEKEALLGIYGALGETDDGTIIDIGGASTELCCRRNGKITTAVSLNIGAVRLFDMCGDKKEALAQVIKEKIAPFAGIAPIGRTVAVGGTATTLASVKLGLTEYDANAVQNCSFTAREIEALSLGLLSLTAEARKKIKGMDENRADIIAGGAYLLSEIMKLCRIERLHISDRDNLEGYLILKGQSL